MATIKVNVYNPTELTAKVTDMKEYVTGVARTFIVDLLPYTSITVNYTPALSLEVVRYGLEHNIPSGLPGGIPVVMPAEYSYFDNFREDLITLSPTHISLGYFETFNRVFSGDFGSTTFQAVGGLTQIHGVSYVCSNEGTATTRVIFSSAVLNGPASGFGLETALSAGDVVSFKYTIGV